MSYALCDFSISGLCGGKVMAACANPQQRKQEGVRVTLEIRSSLLILGLKDGKL